MKEQTTKKEVTNYSLIAFDNEVTNSPEIYLSHHELVENLKKINKKYNSLKKDHTLLMNLIY